MFVVSIHDICPRYEPQLVRWLELLNDWGIRKRSLAVVPYYEQEKRLADAPSLAAILNAEQKQGSEIVLHGYTHSFEGTYRRLGDRIRDRFTTHGCAEFSLFDEQIAVKQISTGLNDLQAILPEAIPGFTAPGWWQSDHVSKVLGTMGFSFYTATTAIHYLDSRGTVKAPALCGLPDPRGVMVPIMNAYNFSWLPGQFKHSRLARVSLHPYDLENKPFMKQVKALILNLASQGDAITYGEFPV